MFAWLKKKFSKKPEVVPQRQAFRPTTTAPPPPRLMRENADVLYIQQPLTDGSVFTFSNPSPVLIARDIVEKQGRSVEEVSFEAAEKFVTAPARYEPPPAPAPRADFTFTEPSSSSSYCDSSDSGSPSCSSD
jgi:hypothetical protein